MNNELKALEDNDTWEITKLPDVKKAIGSNWGYKVKPRLMVVWIGKRLGWLPRVIIK